MQKKCNQRVVYQIFDKNRTLLPFPYPPVYREQATDYICFTSDRKMHSKFWDIRYMEPLDKNAVLECLSEYSSRVELQSDEIQVGTLFGEKSRLHGAVTVPGIEDIPDVLFDIDRLVPTADSQGNYACRKNPVFINGKYNGRPLLLTIGVPVSNQVQTIGRCLAHIKPLLDDLDAELLVIDTGSTDGTIDVCKEYGARIVAFPWCDNMSAARNEGIRNARGEWYLSIDDDEWFENVIDIIQFFKTKSYKKFDTATYIQRNYQTLSEEIYHDNHVLRMARITPELHFEGRIHDAMIVPPAAKNCQLFSCARHYSFVIDDPKKVKEKYIRNAGILLYDVYEYPKNLRYNFQLANELKNERDTELALAWFLRGISIEMEVPDTHFGKLHVVNLISALHNSNDARVFDYYKLLEGRYAMTAAENAFINYMLAEMAFLTYRNADEILDYYSKYCRFLKEYEKDPYESQLRTYIGLQACTSEAYFTNMHVIACCAYADKQEEEKALEQLGQVQMDKVCNLRKLFLEQVLVAQDRVFQAVLDRLDLQLREKWMEGLLDAFFVSIYRDDIYRRQFMRLGRLLDNFSIRGIETYMRQFYAGLTSVMRERLYEYALACEPSASCMQELYLFGYVLREQYISIGKEKKDFELFMQYVRVMGAFLLKYYHPSLLQDTDSNVLAADIRALYLIHGVLLDGKETSGNVRALKQALHVFPGFKSEIQYLSGRLIPQNAHTQGDVSVQDEMSVLAQLLKSQVAALLKEKKAQEAKPILLELLGYFPKDQEAKKMLEQAEMLCREAE